MDPEPDRLTGTDVPDGDATAARIERDIEHTRAEMTETIDALGARLQPSYIKEQAQEAIRDTARSAGTSMIDTLKDNPLPAAIAGLSIAWLVANRSSGERRDDADRGYAARSRGAYAGGRYAAVPTGTYAGGVASGQSPETSLADRASGLADGAKERATDLADEARSRAEHLGEQAHDVQRQAATWLEGQMNDNPLGVGAVALAAGALVGLSLPATDAERSALGEPAGRIVDQVRSAASEQLDRAREVASTVVEDAKSKAGEVAETAARETQKAAQQPF